MAKRKIYTVKVTHKAQMVLMFILFVTLLCWLLQVRKIRVWVAENTGMEEDVIAEIANNGAIIGVGAFIAYVGLAVLSIFPFVGVGTIVLGVVVMAVAVWPLIKANYVDDDRLE